MDKRKYLTRRIIMNVAGMLLSGISVGLMRNSYFGVDPFQCMCGGICNVVSIDFGTVYAIMNVILLTVMLVFYRKALGIYTFVKFFLGYVVDITDSIVKSYITNPGIIGRFVFLLSGLIVLSIGAAFVFSSDLGLSSYDWIAFFITEKNKKIPFKFARIMTDLICCSVGFALGYTPGVATVITALCMGPFIAFFRKHLTDPMVV